MKKQFFLLVFTAFLAKTALAQLQKGDLVLGIGTGQTNLFLLGEGLSGPSNVFGINVFTAEDYRVAALNFSPSIGYAIDKHIVAGAGIGLAMYKQESFRFTSLSVNPFVRGHFSVGVPKLQLLGQISGGLGFAKDNDGFADFDYKTAQIGLGMGAAFFLSRIVSFDALLGYSSSRVSYDSDGDSGNESFSQLGLNIGVSFYLGTKPKE